MHEIATTNAAVLIIKLVMWHRLDIMIDGNGIWHLFFQGNSFGEILSSLFIIRENKKLTIEADKTPGCIALPI